MKKWVIKKSPYNDQQLEVWEYIDTVEEAVKYWYVAKAIRKYGVETVVPLAMNDCGGYHHLPADSEEIVQIVVSDEKPNLSVFQQYSVNSKNLINGWVSPTCVSFSCGAFGHIRCAAQLVKEFKVPETRTAHGDEALLEHGWIKVMNGKWYGRWSKINDNQVRLLDTLGLNDFWKER